MALDVVRLRKEGVYEARAPVAELSTDLTAIEHIAEEWHAARKRLFLGGTLAIAAGVAGMALFVPAGVLLIGGAVYCFYHAKQYPKGVANHTDRCRFLKALMGMLGADADDKKPVQLRVAFDPARELLSESGLLHRKNGKERLFKESWLSLEAALHDGTTVSETIDDLVRQRTFTNARGKSKSKTRTRSVIAMRFDYPAEVYGDATALSARMQKEMRLPESAALRGVEVTPRAVKVKAIVADGLEQALLAQTTSMLALGVYRTLNLSRELKKRSVQGGAK